MKEDSDLLVHCARLRNVHKTVYILLTFLH